MLSLHHRTGDVLRGTHAQGCGVGVGVPQSPRFGPESESESLLLKETTFQLRAPSVLSGLVAVYLTSVQFILQLKLLLYTVLHLLLSEFKISLMLSSSTQSLCHTISPRVGVGVQVF